MFWLCLLGTVTILTIALRRVVTREQALRDNAFSKTIAFEHAQSGIAWIAKDGAVESINAALAGSLGMKQNAATGSNWSQLFAEKDRYQLQNAYRQMLLSGQARLNVTARDAADPIGSPLDLLLVAVHDHKMRFAGHYCLLADRTRERALEAEVAQLRRGSERDTEQRDSEKHRAARHTAIVEDYLRYEAEGQFLPGADGAIALQRGENPHLTAR